MVKYLLLLYTLLAETDLLCSYYLSVGELKFKNPYDEANDLNTSEREFLKNVLFEINKMATMNGGNLNKDMYTTIYEQIFDNIQNKLKSHKIKINQNDIIKITNKINDIKQYEKELIKIFKIMAKYTSQPNLTKLKHTEINYDMMKNFDDKYNKLCNNRIVDKYNKLCNNHNIAIIDIINTFNKINHRISNIIN